jgi:hypothetical protein
VEILNFLKGFILAHGFRGFSSLLWADVEAEYHRRRTGWRIAAELMGAQKTKEKEKGRGQGQNIPFQVMSL